MEEGINTTSEESTRESTKDKFKKYGNLPQAIEQKIMEKYRPLR